MEVGSPYPAIIVLVTIEQFKGSLHPPRGHQTPMEHNRRLYGTAEHIESITDYLLYNTVHG